jgi:hypothetical protein
MTNNLHPALAQTRQADVARQAARPRSLTRPRPPRAPRFPRLAVTLRVLRSGI